jgi:DNA-directed RNA polymerase subunit RPC12/RpoP
MPLTYTKNEQEEYVCPECDFTTTKQNTMHYHLKKHNNALNYKCNKCDKAFIQKQALTLHIAAKHSDADKKEKKFACTFNDCDFKALTKANCIIHSIRMHYQEECAAISEIQDDNKIGCTECKKTYASASAFYYHAKGCLKLEI